MCVAGSNAARSVARRGRVRRRPDPRRWLKCGHALLELRDRGAVIIRGWWQLTSAMTVSVPHPVILVAGGAGEAEGHATKCCERAELTEVGRCRSDEHRAGIFTAAAARPACTIGGMLTHMGALREAAIRACDELARPRALDGL